MSFDDAVTNSEGDTNTDSDESEYIENEFAESEDVDSEYAESEYDESEYRLLFPISVLFQLLTFLTFSYWQGVLQGRRERESPMTPLLKKRKRGVL
jgi:hypothetical protein